MNPQNLRPSDEPVLVGDNSKPRKLGWETQINIKKTWPIYWTTGGLLSDGQDLN